MYPDYRLIGISKSSIIIAIKFFQALGSSMMLFLIPLYLFSLFSSEALIGQITAVAALMGLASILSLHFFLQKFSRSTVYKSTICIYILSIICFMHLSEVYEAYGARVLYQIPAILTPAILALYLRDLTPPQNLISIEGKYFMIANIGWFIGPLIAGMIINTGNRPEESYIPGFIGASICYVIALGIFIIAKFVNKHPHLNSNKENKTVIAHHHIWQNYVDFFQNKSRILSMAISTTESIWTTFIMIYFPLVLLQSGLEKEYISFVMAALSIPIIISNAFEHKILEIFKNSHRALLWSIFGLGIFSGLGILIGSNHILLFVLCFIMASFSIGILSPLSEILFFDETSDEEEEKFYTIKQVGYNIANFLSPLIIGFSITIWGLVQVFSSLPIILLIICAILLGYIKKSK